MIPASQITDHVGPYVAHFERLERERGSRQPAWLRQLRQEALERFVDLGFPTPRQEEWRFTNVAPLARTLFVEADHLHATLVEETLDSLGVAALGGVRVVLVNGRIASHLSAGAAGGLRVRSLRQALAEDPSLLEAHLTRAARFADHSFRALNTAFIDDGVLVEIARDTIVDHPVSLVHVAAASEAPAVVHPRILVVAGANSQVRLVETFVTLGEAGHFTNAVTEVIAADGAVVDHYRIQRESRQAFHVGSLSAHLDRNAAFSSRAVVVGGGMVRNDVVAVLGGEGADCTLDGVYVADGDTLVDNHTEIDHATPHCTSHEVYKGILGGRARGVFNGKIRVRLDAQKTDAKQTNKTLLLSDEAQINTKPQLEIFANDVKCTHGATVGQIDEDQWFYLRARGIGRDEARAMLITAFAGEVVDRIPHAGIRSHIGALLAARLDRLSADGAR